MAGCLILLRVKDRVAPGAPRYHVLTQKWDVITVVPEGWKPGSLDMADGNILFIECPDMDAEEAAMRLCASEPGNPKDNPNLRVRAISLKPDLMPADKAAAIGHVKPIAKKGQGQKDRTWDEIHDEARASGIFVSMTKAEILGSRETKEPLENPFKIGDNPFRIG